MNHNQSATTGRFVELTSETESGLKAYYNQAIEEFKSGMPVAKTTGRERASIFHLIDLSNITKIWIDSLGKPSYSNTLENALKAFAPAELKACNAAKDKRNNKGTVDKRRKAHAASSIADQPFPSQAYQTMRNMANAKELEYLAATGNKVKLHIDHIVPWNSKDGKTMTYEELNSWSNLTAIPACTNLHKAAKNVDLGIRKWINESNGDYSMWASTQLNNAKGKHGDAPSIEEWTMANDFAEWIRNPRAI